MLELLSVNMYTYETLHTVKLAVKIPTVDGQQVERCRDVTIVVLNITHYGTQFWLIVKQTPKNVPQKLHK
ncbi:hypothetical protein Q1695_001127 [Nippostrongylus brasiliensis]|nr:hypothetical protein Q1695_001127 [Nippostrongylus brasiliensis]